MTIAFLLVTFMVLLLLGVPVVFALGIPSVFYFFIQGGNIPIQFMPHSMSQPLFNYVLVALPAFLLMGRMMNATGITDRLFHASVAIVGRFRGGLAHANVFASMLMSSMSGTAIGDAGGLGYVQMEIMTKAGYRREFSAGISAASPILGPIFPPSVSMVILGATAEISIGRLFLAGVFPGFIMMIALMVNVALRAHFTTEGRTWPIEKVPFKQGLKSCSQAVLPMLCPVIIVVSIIKGIVTPTEAAILAINFSILLGLIYRKLTFKKFWKTMEETIVSTGVFMFIIAIAGFFTWILTREGLPQAIRGFLGPLLSSNEIVALLMIAGFLLLIGTFLDTTAAILLVAPVIMPIVRGMGVDVIHFGMVLLVALMIGIITPPLGICVFVLSEVAQLPVKDVQKEAIRYLPAMVVVLLLIIFFPTITTWLPNLVFG